MESYHTHRLKFKIMGVTYGKITAPRAPFERNRLQPVEIRTYPPVFVAEVMCNDAETEEASELLMNYIGFTGMPHNVKGKCINIPPSQVNVLALIALFSF